MLNKISKKLLYIFTCKCVKMWLTRKNSFFDSQNIIWHYNGKGTKFLALICGKLQPFLLCEKNAANFKVAKGNPLMFKDLL